VLGLSYDKTGFRHFIL